MTLDLRPDHRWYGLRPAEQHAAYVLETNLPGVSAHAHDVGPKDGQYDVQLRRDGIPFAAVEVTAAADEASIELWNAANGSSEVWTVPDLEGGWAVSLRPTARLNRLKARLPPLLRILESDTGGPEVIEAARSLGVVSCEQRGTRVPGSIYISIERPSESAGEIDAGADIATWISEFLSRDGQQHNVEKVRTAGLPEAHLFLIVPTFADAPDDVLQALMVPGMWVPERPPALPNGVTHVWLM